MDTKTPFEKDAPPAFDQELGTSEAYAGSVDEKLRRASVVDDSSEFGELSDLKYA